MRRIATAGWVAAIAALAGFAAPAAAEQVTYAKDVAPILNAHCVECHRAGESAPMTLTSYAEARPWAKSIKKAVSEAMMPPWHPDPAIGHWKNDRRLKPEEVKTILAWADAGAPEGDASKTPPLPKFVEGWRIGKPDQVFTMSADQVLPPELEDEYRYVMIPTGFKEARWLKAAEARPGNREVVHHIITFVSTAEALMKSGGSIGGNKGGPNRQGGQHQPGQHPEGQQPNGEKRHAPEGESPEGALNTFLGGYAPGMEAFIMDKGEGMFLPPNAVLVLQMHYHKEKGQEAKDRSSVAIQFADYPIVKEKRLGVVGNEEFRIPAGAANHEVKGMMTVQEDSTIQEIMPHMHLRGKDMKIWAEFPDGKKQDLLFVPKYDFNWQVFYKFSEPLQAPKGTKLFCVAHYDNSKNNAKNPDPNKEVTFGLPTTAEMMFGFFLYTKNDEKLNARDPGMMAGGGGQ